MSHGNDDVEQGFSASARILTNDRSSMCERTLDALMVVKGTLKAFGNEPHLVPIPKELITMANKAYASYKQYLDDQKRKKEKEKEETLKEIARKEEAKKTKQEMLDLL